MKTIIIDDEPLLLEQFRYECGGLAGLEILGCFDFPSDALEFAKKHPVELAFVDLKMPEMDGFALADALRGLHPGIQVIAVTAYAEMAAGRDGARMDGVVLKPVSRGEIARVLEQAARAKRCDAGGTA